MINKKIVLGKPPKELGVKDAVHVAIVSVRAAERIELGARCSLNKYNEAVNDSKGPGIADPFRKEEILTGVNFLMLMNPDEVDNVQHYWEHKKLKFEAPTREIEYDYTLSQTAKLYKVTYQELMEAATLVLNNDQSTEYSGTLTEEELDAINENFDRYDFWTSYAAEVGYEFDNMGSECCPEYEYPRTPLFVM